MHKRARLFDQSDLRVLRKLVGVARLRPLGTFFFFLKKKKKKPHNVPCFCKLNKAMKVGIVGAGVSGVVAGAHLKAAGLDITVFERSSQAGGVW